MADEDLSRLFPQSQGIDSLFSPEELSKLNREYESRRRRIPAAGRKRLCGQPMLDKLISDLNNGMYRYGTAGDALRLNCITSGMFDTFIDEFDAFTGTTAAGRPYVYGQLITGPYVPPPPPPLPEKTLHWDTVNTTSNDPDNFPLDRYEGFFFYPLAGAQKKLQVTNVPLQPGLINLQTFTGRSRVAYVEFNQTVKFGRHKDVYFGGVPPFGGDPWDIVSIDYAPGNHNNSLIEFSAFDKDGVQVGSTISRTMSSTTPETVVLNFNNIYDIRIKKVADGNLDPAAAGPVPAHFYHCFTNIVYRGPDEEEFTLHYDDEDPANDTTFELTAAQPNNKWAGFTWGTAFNKFLTVGKAPPDGEVLEPGLQNLITFSGRARVGWIGGNQPFNFSYGGDFIGNIPYSGFSMDVLSLQLAPANHNNQTIRIQGFNMTRGVVHEVSVTVSADTPVTIPLNFTNIFEIDIRQTSIGDEHPDSTGGSLKYAATNIVYRV